jgi:hypothetical protein
LRAVLDGQRRWEPIGGFTLNVTEDIARGIHSGQMLVYDNYTLEFEERTEDVDRRSKGYPVGAQAPEQTRDA